MFSFLFSLLFRSEMDRHVVVIAVIVVVVVVVVVVVFAVVVDVVEVGVVALMCLSLEFNLCGLHHPHRKWMLIRLAFVNACYYVIMCNCAPALIEWSMIWCVAFHVVSMMFLIGTGCVFSTIKSKFETMRTEMHRWADSDVHLFSSRFLSESNQNKSQIKRFWSWQGSAMKWKF